MRIRFSLVAIATLPFLPTGIGAARGNGPATHPTGRNCTKLTGFSGRPFGIHVTRRGDVIVTAQDVGRIVHLDSTLTPTSYLGVGEDPGDVIANRTGKMAYISGFQSGTIAYLDVDADSVTVVLQLPTRNAYRLALSPNESLLYVTNTEGLLFVFDLGEQSLRSSKRLAGSLQGVALDRSGRNLYVSSSTGDLWRLDRGSLRTIKQTRFDCRAQDVVLSKDDRELYLACEQGSVLVLDPRSLDVIDSIQIPTGSAFGLAVTPDNAQLYVTASSSGNVTVIDRATRNVLWSVYVRGVPRRIAFTARGDTAFVTNEWNWVNVLY